MIQMLRILPPEKAKEKAKVKVAAWMREQERKALEKRLQREKPGPDKNQIKGKTVWAFNLTRNPCRASTSFNAHQGWSAAFQSGPANPYPLVANPRAYILVKADQNSSYGMMQDVMTILQEENATRFNIVTEREATGGPSHSEG